jgi:hypothetical protein
MTRFLRHRRLLATRLWLRQTLRLNSLQPPFLSLYLTGMRSMYLSLSCRQCQPVAERMRPKAT